jgi:hypothetical protein
VVLSGNKERRQIRYKEDEDEKNISSLSAPYMHDNA